LSTYANTTYTKRRFTRRLKVKNLNSKNDIPNSKGISIKNTSKLLHKSTVFLRLQSHVVPSSTSIKLLHKYKTPYRQNRYTKKQFKNQNKLSRNCIKYKFYDKQILKKYSLHYNFFNKTSLKLKPYNFLLIKIYNKRYIKSTIKSFNLVKNYISTLNLTKNYTKAYEPELSVKSKSFNSFILRNSGLFILSKFTLSNKFPYKLKSQFKKKLFSFIYPGQSKKNVLLRRKKQVLTRLLNNSFKIIKSLDRFSYQLYYQLFNIESYNISKHKLHTSRKLHNTLTFDLNLRSIYYNFDYQTKGTDVSDLYIHSEVRIPRVRFKPGYQRI
jgi:hypothetical protein